MGGAKAAVAWYLLVIVWVLDSTKNLYQNCGLVLSHFVYAEQVLFGGWDYSNGAKDIYFNDLHVLDTSSWHWSAPPTPALSPSPRAGMQVAMATDRSYVVFGGRDEDEKFVTDTWVLGWQLPGQQAVSETAAATAARSMGTSASSPSALADMSGVFEDPDEDEADNESKSDGEGDLAEEDDSPSKSTQPVQICRTQYIFTCTVRCAGC